MVLTELLRIMDAYGVSQGRIDKASTITAKYMSIPQQGRRQQLKRESILLSHTAEKEECLLRQSLDQL